MSDTPRTDTAEARIAELERTIAWLRSGGHNRFNHTVDGIRPESVSAHLASSPPPEWKTP